MLTIYKIYENKYFNNLLLNLIKVRYCKNAIIESQDYYIKLNNANNQYANDCIVLKVMLYLDSLLTENGLNENTFIITCYDINNKLSISDIKHFENAITYLSSISYDYKVHSSWYDCNIISSYKHYKGYFKVVFDDGFIELLDRTKQFYQVPKCLLNSDIRYMRHSIFIANYILLHRRRNKGKKNENIIAIKELIKNCPLLASYEKLPSKQRQVQRAIIKPFKDNLIFACRLLGLNCSIDDIPTNYIDFIQSKIIFK